MLELTKRDKEIIDDSYEMFLYNLGSFLNDNGFVCALDCAKEVIRMLHCGKFSMNDSNICTNDYDFLHLPNLDSDGALVMYGVCCCRQATRLLYDLLNSLKVDCSLVYISVLEDNSWRIVKPIQANHLVIKLEENGKSYLLDAVNKFILEVLDNGDLREVEIEESLSSVQYRDSNVQNIGKVLTKYYNLKRLGIDCIYD